MYLSLMIETCRRRNFTNSSNTSCRRRTSHPAVVHELDYSMFTHHNDSDFNDVVNPQTTSASSHIDGIKRLL